VELIRVLLANKIRPILMIAFTNHALDHLLCSVLDAGITTKIARLGSRSADERISEYSIETLEMVAGQSRLNHTLGQNYRSLKVVEEDIKKLMQQYKETSVDSEDILQYIDLQYPEHSEHIIVPPRWISLLHSLSLVSNNDDANAWHHVGRNGRQSDLEDNTIYAYWLMGEDLLFIQRRPQDIPSPMVPPVKQVVTRQNMYTLLSEEDVDSGDTSESEDDESDTEIDIPPEEQWQHEVIYSPSHNDLSLAPVSSPNDQVSSDDKTSSNEEAPPISMANSLQLSDIQDPEVFFLAHGYHGIPSVPSLDRSLEDLLDLGQMWTLALPERRRLHDFWTERIQVDLHQTRLQVHIP